MGIFERQYEKILSEEILKFLLQGVSPSSELLSRKLSQVFSRKGSPIYQFYPQTPKSIFQIDQYNNNLNQIKFDLDLVQEEMLSLFSSSLKRINYSTLLYSVNNYQLDRLKSELESILFTIKDADFYFVGDYDTFIDTSKTDLEKSSPLVVNVKENLLELPVANNSTKRINTGHLIGFQNWNVEVNVPESIIIHSKGLVPGSKFDNMFMDTVSAWNYEVVLSQNIPLEIKLIVPIAGAPEEEAEVFINRIEAVSASISQQKISVRTSTDNRNYSSIPSYENGVLLTDQSRPFSLNFESRLVQYAEITLYKSEADAVIPVNTADNIVAFDPGTVVGPSETYENYYQYIFGLASIKFFTVGRVSKASYISKPFTFDETGGISKISIDSNFIQTPGTSVKYYVALADSDGTIKSDYFPITPVNKVLNYTAPSVIEFGSAGKKSERFSVNRTNSIASSVYGNPTRGKYIYKITESLTPRPFFNSISLFRGYGAWSISTSSLYTDLNVQNCYLDFESANNQHLYAIANETPREITVVLRDHNGLPPPIPVAASDSLTEITLSKDIYYDPSIGHQLIPPPDVGGFSVSNPKFAIYRVLLKKPERQTLKFTIPANIYDPIDGLVQYIGPAGPFQVQLPLTNIYTPYTTDDQAKWPVVRAYAASAPDQAIELTYGTDYSLGVIRLNGKFVSSGAFAIMNTSVLTQPGFSGSLNDQYYIEVDCYLDLDLTNRVEMHYDQSPSRLILRFFTAEPDDLIEVSYRYRTGGVVSEIVKASLRIYNRPNETGDNPDNLYREGVDYIADGRTGTIQVLPDSPMNQTGGYASYSFRVTDPQMKVFSTWCKVDNTDGVEIRFDLDSTRKINKLKIDQTAGEAFYVSGPFGLINIGNAAGIPVIPPGWVQFTVISKNPDLWSSYGSNLINQVIQLRDVNKRKIFREGNNYFSTIIAFRDSMVQKSLDYLRTGTLASDYQTFALVDTGEDSSTIVANFSPNFSNNLYNYAPTSDTSADGNPQLIPETFLASWSYRDLSQEEVKSAVVRIDLQRDVDIDGSITPTVENYYLRVGF